MSRQSILEMVRSRLSVTGEDQTRRQSVQARLQAHQENTRPGIGNLKGGARVEQFMASAGAKGANVSQHQDLTEAAVHILKLLPMGSHLSLTEAALQTGIVLPDHQIDVWTEKTSLENCLSTCFCAIAESGSLVVRSDGGNSLTQNFLADRHFVLLPKADILDAMESVWQRVRETGGMPRDLTLVSGPSSTGDIEMRMEKGAHGPRELYILILDEL
jgi:L-lactate dehydrogenase complex protein LldG